MTVKKISIDSMVINRFMAITIIDNFLDDTEFKKLQDFMMGPWVPWAYNNALLSNVDDDSVYDFQFVHTFYKDHKPHSEALSKLDPIMAKINPAAVLRIKANLNPRTDNLYLHRAHTDVENYKCITALFYVNTNNGYTIFEDGTKVNSVANRFVSFDSTMKHAGTSCTDQKVRVAINFNYHAW
jgi:hypothetical protein